MDRGRIATNAGYGERFVKENSCNDNAPDTAHYTGMLPSLRKVYRQHQRGRKLARGWKESQQSRGTNSTESALLQYNTVAVEATLNCSAEEQFRALPHLRKSI